MSEFWGFWDEWAVRFGTSNIVKHLLAWALWRGGNDSPCVDGITVLVYGIHLIAFGTQLMTDSQEMFSILSNNVNKQTEFEINPPEQL